MWQNNNLRSLPPNLFIFTEAELQIDDHNVKKFNMRYDLSSEQKQTDKVRFGDNDAVDMKI